MDMHSKVKITGYCDATIDNDIVLIRVVYRVWRGRKDYKMWLLPRDFRGTGLFPLCCGRGGTVLDMQNRTVFHNTPEVCLKFVQIANKDYYTMPYR